MHIEPTACRVSIRVSNGNAAQSEILTQLFEVDFDDISGITGIAATSPARVL
jgi:hypothetical protein